MVGQIHYHKSGLSQSSFGIFVGAVALQLYCVVLFNLIIWIYNLRPLFIKTPIPFQEVSFEWGGIDMCLYGVQS